MSLKNSFIYLFIILLGIGTSISSCKENSDDEEDFPPIDRGEFVSNRFLIHFEELRNPGVVTTYEFYAPNGVITKADTIKLRLGASGGFVRYESKIDFMNNADTVTSLIEARNDRYIVCYRNLVNSKLQVGDLNVDKNGFVLGTEAGWKAVDQRGAAEVGTIRITLNYLPGRKENKCDAGSRIVEGNIPYMITN